MDLKLFINPIGDKVDAQSEELITQFEKHYAQIVEAHPEHQGQRELAFQSWIIQKVAGLQLCVAELESRLPEATAE